MKDSLILEGKIYISAKRAAKIINYAQDYIGQLCRSGKLDCKMIGRSWYVTEESLLAHRESAVDATIERVLKVVKSIQPEVSYHATAPAPANLPIVEDVQPKIVVAETHAEFSPVVVEKKVEVTSAQLPSTVVAPAPVAVSKPSPIVSPFTSYKYEAEDAPALPQITKKLPAGFTLPKRVTDLTTTPFATKIPVKKFQDIAPKQATTPVVEKKIETPVAVAPVPVQKPVVPTAPVTSTPVIRKPAPVVSPIQKISRPIVAVKEEPHVAVLTLTTPKTIAIAVVALLIVVSGFMFTIAGRNIQKVAAGESRGGIASNFFAGVKQTLGIGSGSPIASRPSSPNIIISNNDSPYNGIGIVPATGTAAADNAAKEKIKTSFSDEVVIQPDQSGTAGVIKPVFQKGTGDDFVYVLVPVKEKTN